MSSTVVLQEAKRELPNDGAQREAYPRIASIKPEFALSGDAADVSYRSFYQLREKPFSLLPDPAFFYASDKHRRALARLRSGILNRSGAILITGEVGTGKTTLIQHLVVELLGQVRLGLINNLHAGSNDLLQWVLQAFGIALEDTRETKLYQAFVDFVTGQAAQGRRALLIVDEAQNMPASMLEQLRLLMNINVNYAAFQVILVGQPELRSLLQRPAMRPLAQRIVVAHHLQALHRTQTEQYIQHRLVVAGGDRTLFDSAACALIYAHSRGIPRLINSLCDTVLDYACEAKRARINAALVAAILDVSADDRLLTLEGPPCTLPDRSTHEEAQRDAQQTPASFRKVNPLLAQQAQTTPEVSAYVEAGVKRPKNLKAALKRLSAFLA